MFTDIQPGYTSRCVAAEVRARLGAERISGIKFATQVGMSQNYFATRLRDEKSFTIDDIELLCDQWDIEPGPFIERAMDTHGEYVYDVLRKLEQERDNVAVMFPGTAPPAQEVQRAARKSTKPKKS